VISELNLADGHKSEYDLIFYVTLINKMLSCLKKLNKLKTIYHSGRGNKKMTRMDFSLQRQPSNSLPSTADTSKIKLVFTSSFYQVKQKETI